MSRGNNKRKNCVIENNSAMNTNIGSSLEQVATLGESKTNCHWNTNNGSDLDFGFIDMTGQEFALLQATKQHKRTDQSNVGAVADAAEAKYIPVKKEMEFQLPLNVGDTSEEAAQWRPGQAVTAATSSLLAAHQKQGGPMVRQKSAGTGRKRTLTYAEMIGCYVLIEPMSIDSIAIQNEVSQVDSCETGQIQQSIQLRGGRKSPKLRDERKEDNFRKRLFKCYICRKTFRSKVRLKIHSRVHSGEKPYECRVCKKTFSQLSALKTHSRIHTGERPFECQVCNKTFSLLAHLKDHARIHTGEKPYECQVCKKAFSQIGSLKIHSRIHTGEKPYECQVCKKTFSQLNSLNYHSRIHTGERPYKCQVCKKTFSQIASLKQHSRIHSGEKPYQCQVCQQAFTQLSQLKIHSRIHTGERPYQCQVCKMAFAQLSSIKQHVRLHTGERPHQCRVCEKTFSRICSLNKHTRTRHGEKRYECQACKKTYSQFGSLKNKSIVRTLCPSCEKMRSDGLIGSYSGEMESSIEIKLDPDYILAADQDESDTDHERLNEYGGNEDPPMFPRPIKEEIIESEVDTSTEFVTQDEHFVFLDENIEFKSEVHDAI